jgi:hypothetical protein
VASAGAGGVVTIVGGVGSAGAGGAVNVISGAGAVSGAVTLGSGAPTTGNSGAVLVSSAASTPATAGAVTVKPGAASTESGTGGALTLAAGAQTGVTSTGGAASLSAGAGLTQGGTVTLAGGAAATPGDGTTYGGSLTIKPGVGDQTTGDAVTLGDISATGMALSREGKLAFKSTATGLGSIDITVGNTGVIQTTKENGVIGFKDQKQDTASSLALISGKGVDPNGPQTNPPDTMTYQKPVVQAMNGGIQSSGYYASSDRRIKRFIHDTDEEEILQRIQAVEIKKYRYTDAWRKIRGISDVEVRGVIAQQVREVFPEWSTVQSQMSIPGTNFSLDNFHTVNKDQIFVDLVAALHAQHKRFTVTANTPKQSGDIAITSTTGEAHRRAGLSSGDVVLRSGDAPKGGSGNVTIATGTVTESGGGGSISISAGNARKGNGGIVSLLAGASADGTGGSVQIRSGAGATGTSGRVAIGSAQAGGFGRSGNVNLATGSAATGDSGSVALHSGGGAGVRLFIGHGDGPKAGNVQMAAGNAGGVGGAMVLGT